MASDASAFDPALLTPETITKNIPMDVEPYADPQILKSLAPIRKQFDNLAVTEASKTINPRMTSFANQMAKTIYEPVKDRAFLMSGWQLTATLIVVGESGLIVVDPGEGDEPARHLMEAFREATGVKLPVTGVVYSHRHPDHAFGIAGLGVKQEDVDSGKVRIFAHHEFMDYLANDASVVGEILTERTAYGGASYIGQNAQGLVHGGLGPTFSGGEISFLRPTDLVTDKLEVGVSGVKMVMFEAYGDAEDEIDVYFPDLRLVHGSETIQGESFPNLYTLRGTKYRDLVKWYKGVDRMVLFEAYGDAEDEIDVYFPDLRLVHGSETIQGESFPNLYTLRGTKYRDLVKWYKGVDRLLAYARESDAYTHSHMRAWVGNAFIVERIQNYRDAIQYVHDQSIRQINKGATPPARATPIRIRTCAPGSATRSSSSASRTIAMRFSMCTTSRSARSTRARRPKNWWT
ncbi:MBL fold metallo-hydrolase [Mesorhizobium sp. ZMM04-4]